MIVFSACGFHTHFHIVNRNGVFFWLYETWKEKKNTGTTQWLLCDTFWHYGKWKLIHFDSLFTLCRICHVPWNALVELIVNLWMFGLLPVSSFFIESILVYNYWYNFKMSILISNNSHKDAHKQVQWMFFQCLVRDLNKNSSHLSWICWFSLNEQILNLN